MKQRLLYTALMLFAVLGMARAADEISITVPKGKSATIAVKVSPSYTIDLKVDGTRVKQLQGDDSFTVNKNDDKDQSVILSGYILTSLEITGNASALIIDNNGLETLKASGLGLETLTFTNATGLKDLNVSNNKLSGGFAGNGLKALVTLDASNNKISGFPSAFTSKAITSIKFSNNKITKAGFTTQTNLETLEIENNELTSLSVPSTIKTLKVGGNRLTRITGAPDKGVAWGTQTISAKDITNKTANGGFDMADASLNLLFAKAKLTDVEWNKISDSDIKWERQKDGTTYETVTHGVRKHKDAYPSTFYFYDSNNIYTSGTYRATITYNGVTMIVEDIKIDPAKFQITIGSDVHVAKEKSAIKNQEEVSQGDILVVTAKKEGYDLKEFAFSNMQLVDGSTATTNPATFRVEGKWDATNSTDLSPAISASFVDEQVTVKCNDVAASEGSVRITATKGNKITAVQLGETGTKVAKNSTIEIRIAPQVGYEATLAIGGDLKEITPNADGVYVYTIEAKDVKEDLVISVNMKKKAAITLSVKLEGATTTIDDGTFALISVTGAASSSQLWIDNEDAKNLSLTNLEIGKKVQIYFALTKQAVEGAGGNFPSPRTIQDIKLNSTQVLALTTKAASPAPNKVEDAAIYYTASFVVPPTDATLTITTKTLTKVAIKTEKPGAQKHTYDGTAKPFKFTTVPAGLESEMIVKYRASNLTEQTAFAKDAPVAAGTYKVSYSMDATTDHAGIAEDNSTYTIVIDKATPQITKIPTVDVKDGKYVITGGEAKFGDTVLKGRFRVTSDGDADNNINETTQDATKKEAHVVTVKFVAENADGSDNSNFKPAEVNTKSTFEGEGRVEEYTVAVANLPEGVSLVMYNGSNIVASGSKVPKGTKLKFVATIPENMYMGVSANPAAHLRTTTDLDGSSGAIYESNPPFDLEKGTIEYTLKTGITKGEVYTIVGLALQVDKNFKVELPELKVAYTGNAHFYPLDKVIVKNSNDGKISNLSTVFDTYPIRFSYKDKDGNIVALPKDAGKYTVVVTIPYQGRNSEDYKLYKEFTGEFVAALVITPVETELTKAPRPTLIAKNQALKQSELIGGLVKTKDASELTVAGTFDWKDKSATPRDGDICDVVFTPANTNFTGFETTVRIAVSDKNLVTFAQPVGLGVITVSDDKSNVYETGKEVLNGTTLNIQAVALAGFELKSILINGKQYTSSPVSYTVKDESVAIEAIFQPKAAEPEDPIIDPNSQYAVTLPKANDVRGVMIGKPGVNAVLKDKPFSFTLNTLAADAEKVVVKVNGSELKPVDGTYTIAKVSENTTVQVSLANPTPLNVVVETVAKNANGYMMGKVLVEGPSDGVCYYNDKITLAADPESGVTFTGWSDDKDVKNPVRTLTLTKDVTIKALFSGIPTGIESIQTAKVYGVEGYLVIEGVAKGKVTVVGMDGRVQYHQVSGDIRIPLATGVYGYVLEDGSKVIRNKVYVK